MGQTLNFEATYEDTSGSDETGAGGWRWWFTGDEEKIKDKEFSPDHDDDSSDSKAWDTPGPKTVIVQKSIGGNDYESDTVSVTVDAPEITQFNAKKDGRFPVCQGADVSLEEDFVIKTMPPSFEDKIELVSLSPTNDWSSTPGQRTVTIQITGYPETETSAEYKVLNGSEVHKDPLIPDVVNETFTNVLMTSISGGTIGVANGVQSERSGTISGTGTFTQVAATAWGTCGGGVETQTTTGYEVGGSISATWAAAGAQISFSYTTQDSVTFSHPAEGGRQHRIVGYEQPITLTTNYTVSRTRAVQHNIITGWSYGTWVPSTATGTESASGYTTPVKQAWTRCCAQ